MKHISVDSHIEGRIPPQALDIEKAVLGAILTDKDAIFTVLELINETAFYKPAHETIFQAMKTLMAKQIAIDTITVSEELRRNGKLEAIGGSLYLSELTMATTSTANVEYHAKILLQKYMMRGLIVIGTETASRALTGIDEPFEIITDLETKVTQLSIGSMKKGAEDAKTIVTEAMEIIGEIKDGTRRTYGVEIGLRELDYYFSGLKGGHLYVIAGVPSSGKTALALTIMQNIVRRKIPFGIFSLEMPAQQLAIRLLSMRTGYEYQRIENGRLNDDEWKVLTREASSLYDMPFFIDHNPHPNLYDIRSSAKKMVRDNHVRAIAVDYLTLIQRPNRKPTSLEVGEIANGLKDLAKELELPIIALSQLNRDSQKERRRPRLSDLRESGEIEQAADIVMFVHRNESAPIKETEIIIAKHRNGPKGTVKLSFKPERMLFTDIEFVHSNPPLNGDQKAFPF